MDNVTPTSTTLLKVEEYVVVLHIGLQLSFNIYLGKLVKDYATYYYRKKKHWDLVKDPCYIPGSAKKIGLPLHPIAERWMRVRTSRLSKRNWRP